MVRVVRAINQIPSALVLWNLPIPRILKGIQIPVEGAHGQPVPRPNVRTEVEILTKLRTRKKPTLAQPVQNLGGHGEI